MDIQSEAEALLVACQMETGAVKTYTRALALMERLGREKQPLYSHLCAILRDEEGHLAKFRQLAQACPQQVSPERELILTAMAQGTLFQAGLMGAAREGFLDSVPAMLQYAADAERTSAERYRAFARQAQNPQTRETLMQIASEEDRHLTDLEALMK